MVKYELGVAIGIAVCSAVSASIIAVTKTRNEGAIKLNLDAYEPLQGAPLDDDEDFVPKDPFNIIKPEDTVDGYPINEDHFWHQMRLRKIVLSGVILLLVAVNAGNLGYTIAVEDVLVPTRVATLSIHLAFSLYVLVLSGLSIPYDTVEKHWPAIIHISALTGLSAFSLFTLAVLPSTALTSIRASYQNIALGLQISSIVLTTIAFLIASTIPRGPPLHFPPDRIYSAKTLESATPLAEDNVTGIVQASVWSFLLFSYCTPVLKLGYTAESLEIRDLPIVQASVRAAYLFSSMRIATYEDAAWSHKQAKLRQEDRRAARAGHPSSQWSLQRWWETRKWWWRREGSGWPLLIRLFRLNKWNILLLVSLAAVTAGMYYIPAYFLRNLVEYLQDHPDRSDRAWGWFYCAGLFFSNAISYLTNGQLWSVSTIDVQVALKVQLNTILFAKTLLRKDVASASSSTTKDTDSDIDETEDAPLLSADASVAVATTEGPNSETTTAQKKKDADEEKDEDDFSSKAQVMTLMTVDVDRVSDFAWHIFSLVDAPIEIIIGSIFLYSLLGSSSLVGLAVMILFIPINHYASSFVVKYQDGLMSSRDKRVSIMSEMLGAIRMLKFMAWERNFEQRVLRIRETELDYQYKNYMIEVIMSGLWYAAPVAVTVTSFFHYTYIRGQYLSPAIAFTSLSVFNELRFALSALPETFINMLQGFVSLRRIEKYLSSPEVSLVQPLSSEELAELKIVMTNATITWPQENRATESRTRSMAASVAGTPGLANKFVLHDISINLPMGELTLVCGKLGSGKTLFLLALLGETDLLTGQIISPRSPPDAMSAFAALPYISEKEWVVPGICAYVPQVAWLQNASIKENILFNLPYDENRYEATLKACALISDLQIIEDGDEAEIGERGVNLSGGQKARVSLARAVYSRASILLLDDVLSAVDAHTARHIFDECLKGPLMADRTIILVSHHIHLCAPGATYVVALDNGRLQYAGDRDGFIASGIASGLVPEEEPATTSASTLSTASPKEDKEAEEILEDIDQGDAKSSVSTTAAGSEVTSVQKKAPRKLVEEERRMVGRVDRRIWVMYIKACGGWLYWSFFLSALVAGTLMPVIENGWLRHWAAAPDAGERAGRYVLVYALVTLLGCFVYSFRWFILYWGSIQASTVLYKKLLDSVLFANIRFHDTISRGRLLNRFGKDFETLDSAQADNFGRTIMYFFNVITTLITITVVGGPFFLIVALMLGVVYYNVAKVYGQASRDMRRLDSVTRSPLYTIYGESISGVSVLRAFGASTRFLKEMHRHVDTLCAVNPYFHLWSLNRYVSVRFNLLSSAVVGATGVTMLLNKSVSAASAGFALTFASSIMNDLLFVVRRFVSLEQSMVALERVAEFSELPREPPEYIEPRPPASWPQEGRIEVSDLVVRYAPELPDVLHKLNFSVEPGSKIGVLGRTGGGKSTLALSFFRFVEPAEGKIVVDGIDITDIGLADLRSRLTIIPQEPTILSGSIRSTLDVFNEYEDAEIFEALRRVHLIPSEDTPAEAAGAVNANVFRDLESTVSEGGENFSSGEKQLICMARAILKKSKVLILDEATASVDLATDELISQTIRKEFANSTILTIAHRLRTVIDYDKVLILAQGRIAEYDQPHRLLQDPNSSFYQLCAATGKREFEELKKMAAAAAQVHKA